MTKVDTTQGAIPAPVQNVLSWVARNPGTAALVAAAAAITLAVVLPVLARKVKAFSGRHAPEDVLTVVAAGVATAVAMNGMWRFTTDVLHFTGFERITLFAFLELALVTEALRARRNIRESAARAKAAVAADETPERVSAGPDGVAVWAISLLSGIIASLDATGAAAFFRFTAPLVAAWLWERGLSLYRRRLTGRRAVNWRFTLERVAVWAGVADASERTADEADMVRRIGRLARSAKRARRPGWGRKWWAGRRLDSHLAGAVAHAKLATEPAVQRQLRDTYGALLGAEALTEWTPAPPWRDARSGARVNANADATDDASGRQVGASGGRQRKRQMNATEREAAKAEARRLLTENWTMPIDDVAAQTGLSPRTVDRVKAGMPTPIHLAEEAAG